MDMKTQKCWFVQRNERMDFYGKDLFKQCS